MSAVVCASFGTPLFARAQNRTNIRRIGYLGEETDEDIKAERAALTRLGWIEGQNLIVERHYAKTESLRSLAEELVRLRVELIVASGTDATLAAMSVTRSIPIVFGSAGDPVGAGLVASLARPGGNVTGFSIVATEITVKRLAVLRELLPTATRVGILETSSAYYRDRRKGLEQACRSLGVQPIFVEVGAPSELANAVAEVARGGGRALQVHSEVLFEHNRIELMRAAVRHALPTATSKGLVREVGALVSYDYDDSEQDSRVAAFIDRVLRGAKPADLPVEQPTKFELRVNLKTAKTFGISVPRILLARAHEVIE